MSKYKVKARAYKRTTGTPIGRPRVEVIDTASNILFNKCFSPMMVKEAYESFWNDLNPHSEEIVKVIEVKHIPEKMPKGLTAWQKENWRETH